MNRNIKYLIHVLDSNIDADDRIVETAAMALSNFSADFFYHEFLLKEPEITMVFKILNNTKEDHEGRVLEHILALITNLTTNPMNAQKLFQKHIFESLIRIMKFSVRLSLRKLNIIEKLFSWIYCKINFRTQYSFKS